MRKYAQGMNLTSADQGVAQCLDVCHGHGSFFPQHVSKFIEHLNADDALACQQLFNSVSSRAVIHPIIHMMTITKSLNDENCHSSLCQVTSIRRAR